MTFARRLYVPLPRAPVRPATRRATYSAPAAIIVVPKAEILQHSGYMAIVRGFPCMHCGRAPRSQFCHADEGKGTSLKTDCRRGWPGCAACHYLVGSTGKLGREGRRALEADYGARTRVQVLAAGLWPKRLPLWEERR